MFHNESFVKHRANRDKSMKSLFACISFESQQAVTIKKTCLKNILRVLGEDKIVENTEE